MSAIVWTFYLLRRCLKHGKRMQCFRRRLSVAAEAVINTKPYKLYKLDKGPGTSTNITRDDALLYCKQMETIRRLELTSGSLYEKKLVRGFCHLYAGQEACAVGIKSAMKPNDSLITSYRAHGWSYLMGIDLPILLAELLGRKAGCSRGKGGSMHLYTKNFYGGNGIVGAQVPLGVGVAFSIKYKGEKNVSVALYGDGAANQGQVFEVFNMAKLWNLPCIFICENNYYGMGTSAERSSAHTDYYTRAHFLPGIWIDAMDILTVREAMRFAIDHALSGAGPIVLEMSTYRYYGHSMSDPGVSYRSREEVQLVRKTRDPIEMFKNAIIKAGLVTQEEVTKITKSTKEELKAAEKVATGGPEAKIEEVTADIYRQPLEKMVRGVNPWDKFVHKSVRKVQQK